MKKWRFKKQAVIWFLLAVLYLAPGLLSQALTSVSAVIPKTIDGLVEDWEGVTFQNIKKANVDYAVANDDKYLYLGLIIGDPGRIMREQNLKGIITGITIYLSQTGKKNKDIGFFFVPRRLTGEEAISELETSGQKLSEEQKEKIRLAKFITFYNGEPVGKELKKRLSAARGQPIEKAIFRMSSTKESLIYEMRIPLKLAESLEPILQPGQSFNLGLEWGGKTVDLMAMQYLQMELMRLWSALPEATVLPELGTQLTDLPTHTRFKQFNFWNEVQLAMTVE
ncbi:MAG: hypothetical protein PHQ25_07845 [Acidobacteriota bacterium]|nr:hypothetical protein [Acidobacteriota bacterium]